MNSIDKSREKLQNCQQSTIGFIARNFKYITKELILPLYKSLVLPHLEYSVQFWSTHFALDIDKIEEVQKRATKIVRELINFFMLSVHTKESAEFKIKGVTLVKHGRLKYASAGNAWHYDHNFAPDD